MFILGIALATLFFFFVLKWWSEGIFDISEGILLATIGCGLIFGTFAARETWQFLLAIIPLLGASGYALYSYKIGGIRSYYKRRCDEYIATIAADPRNRGAREHLADCLYNLGDLDRAIDELQAAVDIGADFENRNKLAKWTKERHLRETHNPVCKWCESENAPGNRVCSKCGSDLPYDNALSRWLVGGKNSTARCYLIIVAGVALVSFSVRFISIKYAYIPLGLCALAMLGWSLVRSARS